MINDSKGLYNVGSDPLAMFTFGNKTVSDELEKAVGMGVTTKNWTTYDEYLNFIFGKLDNTTKQETGSATNYNTWSKTSTPTQMAQWLNQQVGNRSSQAVSLIASATNQMETVTSKFSQSGTLKDSEVLGNEKYLVSSSADKTWNENINAYDGTVKIYYNPSTKRLLTDELNVSSGMVYLKGNIISTGGGSIVAAKGAANITIDTSGNASDLYLGAINNADRTGRISIEDTAKNSLTTIYTGYDPVKNSAYSWTGGISYTTTVSKQYSDDSTLWGMIDTGSTATFIRAVGNKATTVNTRISSGGNLYINGNIKIDSTGNLLLGAVAAQNGRLDLSAYGNYRCRRDSNFGSKGQFNVDNRRDRYVKLADKC